MGELIVKEFERNASTEVSIFLDLDAGAAWGRGREHTLEYAVRIAASVSEYASGRGNAVQLVAHASSACVSSASCLNWSPCSGSSHTRSLRRQPTLMSNGR